MKKPVIISLCDKSGVMVQPWALAGCVCLCIDIQHSIRATKAGRHRVEKVGGGEIHYIYGDARSWTPLHFDELFFQKYYIVLVACFPVCTELAGSGSQDYSNKKGRPLKGIPRLMDGLMLFNACEQVAAWSGAAYFLENPSGVIPTHHRKPDFYFHPWFFGDLYSKKTCLWTGNGFNMPDQEYIEKPAGVTQKIWTMSPGKDRQDKRSETPAGFARAVFKANYSLIELKNEIP